MRNEIHVHHRNILLLHRCLYLIRTLYKKVKENVKNEVFKLYRTQYNNNQRCFWIFEVFSLYSVTGCYFIFVVILRFFFFFVNATMLTKSVPNNVKLFFQICSLELEMAWFCILAHETAGDVICFNNNSAFKIQRLVYPKMVFVV